MRKGFFFSLDAFFAIMIFTLVLVSVYTYFVSVEELRQQYFYSEDLLNIFSNIKIGELEEGIFLEEDKIPNFVILKYEGVINEDLTIMEQIRVLISDKDHPEYYDLGKKIFEVLTSDLIGIYGISFDIGMIEVFESEKGKGALVSRQRYVPGS